MAKYTMEIRELISTFGEDEVKGWFKDYNLSDYLTAEEIQVIEDRGCWNKDQLADRIIDYYYTREIGSDAIGSFILFTRNKMREVMETYAPLIYSASIKYDPLVNVDYVEELNRTTVGQTSSQSASSDLGINSDTPMGQINKGEILSGKYASSTVGNEGSSTGSGESSGTENYSKRVKGNSGVSATAQKMVEQYRDNIRALNSEIVEDLEPLFISVF
jgi:hypothetical protein